MLHSDEPIKHGFVGCKLIEDELRSDRELPFSRS